MKKRVTLKAVICITAIVTVMVIAATWALSVHIYNENFDRRFETYEPMAFKVEEFDGLERTRYEFTSDKGQKLVGYLYSSGSDQHGIVVMAHGFGGGGHNSYIDVADRFARSGYYAFAYDATGNDESEGNVGGLCQGVIDLDHAITFVENEESIPDMPIVVFGHSWGGYCAGAVLKYHPEVKAVIECSGFNASSDMFEIEGKRQAGNAIYAMLPFVELHDRIKFGSYSDDTAVDGAASSDAAVMVVHSSDDKVVPPEYGYDLYYDRFKDDPRFTFVRLEDKGHNYVYDDLTYPNEFNIEYDEWKNSLGYDITAPENSERFSSDKDEYMRTHLDREKWTHMLDEDLFDRFVAFYDEHI
ncbi:MAG: alpha/beta fold hydrolase [Oscillospiraceae bacterium]|nr:alpha/beta fold hydrolase [Oscillospiraceae bacterium]